VCFVGIDRTYPPENEADVEAERQKFLEQRCSVDAANSCQFTPRSPSEQPHNAVSLADSSKQLIRTTVLMEILSRATNLVPLNNKSWNVGGMFDFIFLNLERAYLLSLLQHATASLFGLLESTGHCRLTRPLACEPSRSLL